MNPTENPINNPSPEITVNNSPNKSILDLGLVTVHTILFSLVLTGFALPYTPACNSLAIVMCLPIYTILFFIPSSIGASFIFKKFITDGYYNRFLFVVGCLSSLILLSSIYHYAYAYIHDIEYSSRGEINFISLISNPYRNIYFLLVLYFVLSGFILYFRKRSKLLLLPTVSIIGILFLLVCQSVITERAKSLDRIRYRDFEEISTKIHLNYPKSGDIPTSLQGLDAYIHDPKTKQEYQISKVSAASYKLCTEFSTDTYVKEIDISWMTNTPWKHKKGNDCAIFSIPSELVYVPSQLSLTFKACEKEKATNEVLEGEYSGYFDDKPIFSVNTKQGRKYINYEKTQFYDETCKELPKNEANCVNCTGYHAQILALPVKSKDSLRIEAYLKDGVYHATKIQLLKTSIP